MKITLTVHDERGKEVPFQTEPLNNQPKNLAVTGVGNQPQLTQQGSGQTGGPPPPNSGNPPTTNPPTPVSR